MPCTPAFSESQLENKLKEIRLAAINPFTKPSKQCTSDMLDLWNSMQQLIECKTPHSDLRYVCFRNAKASILRHEYMMRVPPKIGAGLDIVNKNNFLHGNGTLNDIMIRYGNIYGWILPQWLYTADTSYIRIDSVLRIFDLLASNQRSAAITGMYVR
eukprot:243583_1